MNGRRIMVAGGMLLIFAGLFYAIGHVIFFSSPLDKSYVNSLELALDMAIKGQMEMARGYVRELAALEHRRWVQWLVVGHLFGAGVTALAISSFMRALELKKKWEKILSYLFIFGGALSAAGFLVQLLGYGLYGRGLSVLGYIWQLAAMAGFIIALVSYVIAKPEPK